MKSVARELCSYLQATDLMLSHVHNSATPDKKLIQLNFNTNALRDILGQACPVYDLELVLWEDIKQDSLLRDRPTNTHKRS